MAGQATAAGPRLGGADGEAGRRAHADRAFNLAFRVTGSESHAADATLEAFRQAHVGPSAPGGPDPALQLIGATYDAAGGRVAEDPPVGDREGAGVSAANSRLPPRDRALLALPALYGLSYDQIAQVMGLLPGEVGFLLAAAWIELDEQLSGPDRMAKPGTSDDCEQALALMAERDDGELRRDSEEGGWLIDHLARCGECRAALDAMQRARLAYSAWEPVATPPALFAKTMGDGADPQAPRVDLDRPQGPATVPQSEAQRRRRRDALLAAGWAAALLLGVLAVLSGGVFSDAEGEETLPAAGPEPSPRALDPAPRPAPRRRPERRPEEAAVPAPVVQPAPRVPVVVVPRPATRGGAQAPRPPARRPAERPRVNPPTPAPRQQRPAQPEPEAGEEAPTVPAPPQPPAAGCTNPAGRPVPC